MIMDDDYLPDDYEKQGWGHSSVGNYIHQVALIVYKTMYLD